jgi:hypothetical protein
MSLEKNVEKIVVHILTKCLDISFGEYIALYMIVVEDNFHKTSEFFSSLTLNCNLCHHNLHIAIAGEEN